MNRTYVVHFILTRLISTIAFGGGLPVIDAAAIAAGNLSAQRDLLEQVLQESNQVTQIKQAVQQVRLIDGYLSRFGDPAVVRDPAALSALLADLEQSPLGSALKKKSEPIADGEIFRPLNGRKVIDKEITVNGTVEAARDSKAYEAQVLERRAHEQFSDLRASVTDRRDGLRKALAVTMREIQSASTASEVQKLSATLIALQTELQSVDNELRIASDEISAVTTANATEKEIQRKAQVEKEAALFNAGNRKDAKTYKLFVEPIRFGEP